MPDNQLWPIILAGGEGERLRPFIERWLGRHIPKQYCTFTGSRSMFQRTIDRADCLADPDHRVTVIAPHHRPEAERQIGRRPAGLILEQPANRDTAAGIFLPLTHILARDPKATVVLFPSDHFIDPEERLLEIVRSAVSAVETVPNKVILLAARPHSMELDYGWITAGPPIKSANGSMLRRVMAFHEKPDRTLALPMLASGAMWNTLILVAKAHFLWHLGRRRLPQMVGQFETLAAAIGRTDEASILQSVYAQLPSRNFCSDLLSHCAADLAVLRMDGVLWCDWGRPERIFETLLQIGETPAFGPELLRPVPEQADGGSDHFASPVAKGGLLRDTGMPLSA